MPCLVVKIAYDEHTPNPKLYTFVLTEVEPGFTKVVIPPTHSTLSKVRTVQEVALLTDEERAALPYQLKTVKILPTDLNLDDEIPF